MLFLLTLLALLAGGARASSEPGDARSCGRDQPRPTITATTASTTSYKQNEKAFLDSSYSDAITLLCSSSGVSTLTVRDNEHILNRSINSDAILVSLKPKVGYYRYYCSDSNTGCSGALSVMVLPAMSVTSPRVHRRLLPEGILVFFVPRSETYNVICSANEAETLSIYLRNGHKLETMSVNQTTVAATVKDDTSGGEYICEGSKRALSQHIYVIMDHYPEARELQCISHQRRDLKCSWDSLNKKNRYRLFMLNHDRKTLICIVWSASILSCTMEWSLLPPPDKNLHLQMQTCNEVFCSVQTFHINSIIKLDPVDLNILWVNSRVAGLAWRHEVMYQNVENYAYKVEYRIRGIRWTDWRPVNTTTMRCGNDDDGACELQLSLLCPDAQYEARVYIRNKQAIGDIYWSKPAAIFFFTNPSDSAVDSACNADVEVPESSIYDRSNLLHEVRELISDERMESRGLRQYVFDLKEKLANLREFKSRMPSTTTEAGDAPPRVVCAGLSRDEQFNHKLDRYKHNQCSSYN